MLLLSCRTLSSLASLQSNSCRPASSVALLIPDWRSQFHTAFRRCLFEPSGEALAVQRARLVYQASHKQLRPAQSSRSLSIGVRSGLHAAPKLSRQLGGIWPGARSFSCAAGCHRFESSMWLVRDSFLWANGCLTIHSSRTRFAASPRVLLFHPSRSTILGGSA
jgi:hypothetical protein